MTTNWRELARKSVSSRPDISIPDNPAVSGTRGKMFVEAVITIERCWTCGDALLPCEACKSICCSNVNCGCSVHDCPALKEE